MTCEYMIFHIFMAICISPSMGMLQTRDQLPDGLIAQLVEHCTGIAEARGSTPLYKVYRYVPPQRAWCLSRFGLETGIDFKHFGLKLGMGHESL